MADDKYAPKPTDGVDVIHRLHRELIKSQQVENRKARDEARKKPVPARTDALDADKAQPTQPPAVASPQNPDAPQNKPIVPAISEAEKDELEKSLEHQPVEPVK